ncbi:hypothetical protein BH23GEM3_BH23GEM3_20860 [soil metagenome]|nr:hypothetical protein [Gemmatimonadota bacterium]
MADINVERKGPSIWPWILGLIALALLIWALTQMFGRDDRRTAGVVTDTMVTDTFPAATPMAPAATAEPAAVQQFAQWVDRRDAQEDAGLQHQYTVNGLRSLADALEAVVQQRGVDAAPARQEIETIRTNATQLEQSDWQSQQHANVTRQAFTAAADAMGRVHQQHYTGVVNLDNQVRQVRESAQAVQPAQPLLEQRDTLHRFFERSRDALTTMSRAPVV